MKKINKNTIYIALGTLVIGVLLGGLFFGSNNKPAQETNTQEAELAIWTCTMHPQIRKTEPGLCPICGMELVSLNREGSDVGSSEVRMTPTAMQLANVQTSIVKRQKPVKEIRMNGKVKPDERKLFSQVSHIPGRLERLLVDFTGEYVSSGQTIAYVYSPELVTAQDELLEAYKIKETQPELYNAAREKLKNWKLSEQQIDNILSTGKLQERFPVIADVSGIVSNKRVNTGDYVQRGQALFEIANLNTVWVLFDVYEQDLAWINKGDAVNFSVQSLPGKVFKSKVDFIDPVIDPARRVASARVQVSNQSNQLKPEMFATGIIETPLKKQNETLVIPKSAVMWTGERSIVYVQEQSAGSGYNFMMREVVLGPMLGDSYVVKEGLEEGEEIVTNGTFSVDAAAQLAGKPSMMNPEGGAMSMSHNHGDMNNNVTEGAGKKSINDLEQATIYQLVQQYELLKDALVDDDFNKSKQLAKSLYKQIKQTDMSNFDGLEHKVWMQHSGNALNALEQMKDAKNIGELRRYLKPLSGQIIIMSRHFAPFKKSLYVMQCPMADKNNGADWISFEGEVKNPYYGADMLSCGSIIDTIQ
ncbi:MAG: efflux RND transporter periplasmic adaptor subunit [Flavipsychrobacter sp.]